jgi:hypothetical protein
MGESEHASAGIRVGEAELHEIAEVSPVTPYTNTAIFHSTNLSATMLRDSQQSWQFCCGILNIFAPHTPIEEEGGGGGNPRREVQEHNRQTAVTCGQESITPFHGGCAPKPLLPSTNKKTCWHCLDGTCCCIVCAAGLSPGESGGCVVCKGRWNHQNS